MPSSECRDIVFMTPEKAIQDLDLYHPNKKILKEFLKKQEA
jgi:hypothetical protein